MLMQSDGKCTTVPNKKYIYVLVTLTGNCKTLHKMMDLHEELTQYVTFDAISS